MNHLGLLGRNPAYGTLWTARTVSFLGSMITLTALLLYLKQTGVSATQVGVLLAVRTVPPILGPVAGTISDRIDQRKLMIGCDLGQTAVIGTIALLLPPYWLLVVLVALSSVLSTLFLPVGKSMVPRLVSREELTGANALLGSSFNLSIAAGPVMGALLVAGPGARAAFAIDAATFLISAALLLRLSPLPPPTDTNNLAEGFFSEVRQGLSYLISHRVARAVAAGLFLSVAFAALDNVGLVFLVTGTLNAAEIAFGTAQAVYGVAMIAVPLLLLRFSGAAGAPGTILVLGLALTGAGLILTGLSPTFALLIVFYFVAGAGNGLENVACDTLIGRTVSPQKMGRVFGAVYGPIFLAESLAAAVGGPLLEITSPRTVFVVAGTGVLGVLFLVRTMLPRSLHEEADVRETRS